MRAYNGDTATCYQTKYSISKHWSHGGGYPSTEKGPEGGVGVERNDWCMLVPVLENGQSNNGWNQGPYGFDGPRNDNDYPNSLYTEAVHVNVWIK